MSFHLIIYIIEQPYDICKRELILIQEIEQNLLF